MASQNSFGHRPQHLNPGINHCTLQQQKETQGTSRAPPKEATNISRATPYYHCTSRCVRRAFLCGLDALTGKDYEYRRQWVEDRILFLGEVFCIDVCAYAVMSNHHHVVLHINMAEAQSLTDLEVCERWHKLYKGTLLTQKFFKGELLDEAQILAVKEKLDHWRLELANISRWMWALNEPIARMANAEDQCTGRFWESRFKSQALLDEKALAACMAYVDLNPIRAKMAKTPEESEHTSIKRRIENQETNNPQPLKLAEFVGNPREPKGTQGNPCPRAYPFIYKITCSLWILPEGLFVKTNVALSTTTYLLFLSASISPAVNGLFLPPSLNLNSKVWLAVRRS